MSRTTLVRKPVALLLVLAAATGHAAESFVALVDGAQELPRATFEAPDLSRTSPRARLVAFDGRGTKEVGVVTTCVALEASGWVEEAEPIAFERIAGMAAAAILRARGAPPAWHMEPSRGPQDPKTRRRELVPDAGDNAEAALFLGFTGKGGHEAIACWAVSFGAHAPKARNARFSGPFSEPPASGLLLRALVWSVHNPRNAFGFGLAIALVFVAVYLHTRPRPKVR